MAWLAGFASFRRVLAEKDKSVYPIDNKCFCFFPVNPSTGFPAKEPVALVCNKVAQTFFWGFAFSL